MFFNRKDDTLRILYDRKNGQIQWPKPKYSKPQNLVLIYSMGKVGSTSLYDSLEGRLRSDFSLVKLEGFNENRIGRSVKVRTSPRAVVNMLSDANNIIGKRDFIRSCVSDASKEIYIITGFREPVSCSISAFFQNLHYFFPLGDEMLGVWTEKQFPIFRDLYVEILEKSVENKYENGKIYSELFVPFLTSAVDFFEKEMPETLGIDIFSLEFDQKLGVLKADIAPNEKLTGGGKLLLYDVRKLGELESKVNSFLKPALLGDIGITTSNSAQQKGYFEAYRYVLDNVRLPKRLADYFYGSRYVKHFFEPEHIERLYEKHAE